MQGLLVIDKPAGLTSQRVVARIKHRLADELGIKPKKLKVGHAGTLDPMATGVLVIGVAKATPLLGTIAGHDKSYTATIRLGSATTTDDAEGQPIGEPIDATGLEDEAIKTAINNLTGQIQQVPSQFSAIKVNGQRAYKLARSGQDFELAARPITVTRFEILSRRDAKPFVDLDVLVECSTGTYVRALARDLGQALGVGGHLTALRRDRVGVFSLDQALAIDDISLQSLMGQS